MERTFDTPGSTTLHVEVGAGEVNVLAATDCTQTHVEVSGRGAEDTRIEQSGGTVSVIAPRHRRVSMVDGVEVHVQVTLPAGSALSALLGSARLITHGRLGDCRLKSGSGDIRMEEAVSVEAVTGSGPLHVDQVEADFTGRSGSGDIAVRRVGGRGRAVTGSGDVTIGSAAAGMHAKSGSGDVTIDQVAGELTVTTASGRTVVHQVDQGKATVRSASGDITVGVHPGTPTWTDIATVSGTASSRLEPLGPPEEGQDFVELALHSVSGDIVAHHVAPARHT